MFVHLPGCFVHARTDPAVRSAVLDVPVVQRFGVHQHVACRVPELVAEIPVAFDSTDIETDITPGRRERAKRHAQGVTPVGVDAVWEMLACRLLDFRREMILHHAGSAFPDE